VLGLRLLDQRRRPARGGARLRGHGVLAAAANEADHNLGEAVDRGGGPKIPPRRGRGPRWLRRGSPTCRSASGTRWPIEKVGHPRGSAGRETRGQAMAGRAETVHILVSAISIWCGHGRWSRPGWKPTPVVDSPTTITGLGRRALGHIRASIDGLPGASKMRVMHRAGVTMETVEVDGLSIAYERAGSGPRWYWRTASSVWRVDLVGPA
jgi:hypothetical protein